MRLIRTELNTKRNQMNKKYLTALLLILSAFSCTTKHAETSNTSKTNQTETYSTNPIIKNKFTADPAAMVSNNTVYLYTGHDEAPDKQARYVMHDWTCFSSTDLVHWTEHPTPLSVKDFSWALDDAWASQVIERNHKFYWYVAISHKSIHGKAIGVAVADNPTGPFKDAIGKALITNDMTTDVKISWMMITRLTCSGEIQACVMQN
jgi:beta-xylosidase